MTQVHVEHEDHRRILAALDCSQQVAAVDKDVSLLRLQIQELKEDKDKAASRTMWIVGMAFSVIMAVAGSLINSNATISVLEEKVKEQKSEIEKLLVIFNGMTDDVNDAIANHKH